MNEITRRIQEIRNLTEQRESSEENREEIEFGEGTFQGVVPGRPQISIRFRFLSGRLLAFPYAILNQIEFLPSGELVLRFHHCLVQIEGRNLQDLFDRVAEQRIRSIEEREELHSMALPDETVVVTKIRVAEEK